MQTIKQFKIVPVANGTEFKKTSVTSSDDAFEIIRQFWHDDIGIYESFFILLLNRAKQTIGWAKISQGGIAGTIVEKKIVCKYAVDSLASGIIFAHNHPSGNLTPSQADKNITKELKKCLDMFDCAVLDHLILTPDGKYYSLANNGDF